MLALKRATGRTDDLLVLPHIPLGVSALWAHFAALVGQRRNGMSGLHPLTWGDVGAYSRLYNVHFTPWELDTLRALDAACVRTANELAKERAQRRRNAAEMKRKLPRR